MNKKRRVVPGSYSPGGNSRVSERGPGGVQVTQAFKQTPLKRNAKCGHLADAAKMGVPLVPSAFTAFAPTHVLRIMQEGE